VERLGRAFRGWCCFFSPGVFCKVNLAVKEASDEPDRKQTGNN